MVTESGDGADATTLAIRGRCARISESSVQPGDFKTWNLKISHSLWYLIKLKEEFPFL